MRHRCRLFAAMGCLLGMTVAVRAEVTIRRLPEGCVDVALDPDSGNLLALSETGNTAQFFRAAAWQQGDMEPAARLAVGKGPAAVVFKRFRDTRVFVIACEQDPHIYLLNADTGALTRKIPIAADGAGDLATALNPDDPFVYCIPVPGRDENVAAVSLRTMQDLGPVIPRSRDCAISASGAVAYSRRPGLSPTGFASLLRTSSLTADKPVFVSLFEDHADAERYVPDPFDRHTATGSRIYVRSLEEEVAQVDFKPLCWFRTRPLVVGIGADEPRRSGPAVAERVVLRAASSNTFRPAGGLVAFEPGPRGQPPVAPAVAIHAVGKADRVRMFAHETGARVLYARRSVLALVPLADFRIADEPFLTATLTGGDALLVGREAVLKLGTADPRVRLRIEWLPDGMRASGSELRWKPTVEQVGPTKVVVSLAHGDIERTQTFELVVRRPSVLLPFEPVGITVTDDGRTAFIWDGNSPAAQNQPRPADLGFRQMATIDLVTGTVRAEKRTPDQVQRALATEGRAFLVAPDSERCDVHDLVTLERVRTLVATAPIEGIERGVAGIILRTKSGLDVFDATTLQKKQQVARDQPRPVQAVWNNLPPTSLPPPLSTARGIVADGVLFAADGKPALLMLPPWLPALPGADPGQWPGFLRTRLLEESLMSQATTNRVYQQDTQRLASAGIPRTAGSVWLEQRSRNRSLQQTSRSWRQDFDLWLMATGDRPLQEVLDRQVDLPRRQGDEVSFRAAVCAGTDEVFVTFTNRLYTVSLPPAIDVAKKPAVVLTPRQSMLVLDADGPATLRHETEGGRPPFRFALVKPLAGLSIDEATGTVTIDRSVLLKEAARLVEKLVIGRGTAGSYADACRPAAESLGERVTELTGQQPAGFPVLVPIRVLVTDAASMQDTMQYHFIAGVPDSLVLPQLRKQDADHLRPPAPVASSSPQPVPQPVPPERIPQDQRALARRVELLEQQLDLITRQLNEILNRVGE
jgi:hypothetical protein